VLESTLKELEMEGWEALVEGTGAAFYQRLLADDALVVLPMGVLSKEQTVAAFEQATPWGEYRMEDVRCTALPRGGILTYRATARRPGAPAYVAWMTSAYVDEGGGWRMVLHQQTPVETTTG